MSQAAGRLTLLGLIAALALALAGCGSPQPEGVYKLGRPYQIAGRWYYPEFDPDYDRVGVASWYGAAFDGRATANGEVFDRAGLSAAHPTLPLPSIVRVTNLANRRQIDLRVNDRGPFVGDRLIDLSQGAARALGFERQGLAKVRVEFVGLADAKGAPPQPPARPVVPPAARTVLVAAPAPPAGPAVARSAPAPAPPEPPAPLAPLAQCEARFIQIGAFAEPERAWQTAERLFQVTPAPVTTQRLASDALLRVRVGPIADPGAAAAALAQLKRSGYAGAFIVGDGTGVAAPC
jgi:rare lipoprotein A